MATCPDAWLMNLTNPLSVTTALLAGSGIARCFGVCELPRTTAREIARELGVEFDRMRWSYTGLNHRGFVHDFSIDDEDMLPDLVRRLDGGTLHGVGSVDISTLGCVPTKYFALLTSSTGIPPRAMPLAVLRRRILTELARTPTELPPSLGDRRTDWYDDAVVPALAALAGDGSDQVVNVALDDDIVRERRVRMTPGGLVPVAISPAPAAVQPWLERYDRHERQVMAAVVRPCASTIRGALQADPAVPAAGVGPLTNELATEFQLA